MRHADAISQPGHADDGDALAISLLGPMTLSRGGHVIELNGPKRRALLAFLVIHRGVTMPRDSIVEALWPHSHTGREDSTLQVHVSHVRDRIEAHRSADPHVVITRGSGYCIAAEAVSVDIDRFQALASAGRAALTGGDPAAALAALDEALGLWRGRALQDVQYEDFAQDEIRRLDLLRDEAVLDRTEALIELGRDLDAIETLETVTRTDPGLERPTRLLMTASYHVGRHADALRIGRRHTDHLLAQGIEASPAMRDLEHRILTHHPDLLPPGLTSPADVATGRSVRGYELREEIGEDAFGKLYRAFQSSVGRQVAVRVVHPAIAQARGFALSFAETTRKLAGLEHPHIVPIHDFWREPAGAFVVMRWMDGGSLADRLGGAMPLARVGQVFDQLANALGYAHSAGIVHRRLTAGDVLFDGAGNAYVSDFTVAVPGIEAVRPPQTSAERCPGPALGGEGPTVASDLRALGLLLAATVASRAADPSSDLPGPLREVIAVATADDPADRYPDMEAFRAALRQAIGSERLPVPRRVRRNPYKGLAPFEESDRADFYGRDDVVDSVLGLLASRRIVTVVGASGSGKSSLVSAGVLPQLRAGALLGSEQWSVVTMVPGTDPFEEFRLALRDVAVTHAGGGAGDSELRNHFADALDGPNSRALLVVDQFEELFSSEISDATRQRFLDNLVDLAVDPSNSIAVLLTLRADFSDRPLSNPRFGEWLSVGSILLGPMGPEQIEDVIRRPAARVGVEVEPGLVSQIVRDFVSAPASLPLLQYLLSELFERRREDRLTVAAYRELGGIDGVLQRRAESTYAELGAEARDAARQMFLRMVHLGEHGEETRRRVSIVELRGLAGPAAVEEALEAFTAARIVTYDRDPVSRAPTIEVTHETVISNWSRLRVWLDDARRALVAHREVATAAAAWSQRGEDPAYLLRGGPLASASEWASRGIVELNELERRFLGESRDVEEAAVQQDRVRERRESELRVRARRLRTVGVTAAIVALVVGVLAAFAVVQRRRADDLAAARERESRARELAALALSNLDSDPELSLLLATAAADATLDVDGIVLPEVVDAVHQSLIAPKPDVLFTGAATGNVRAPLSLDWSDDGAVIAVVDQRGGVTVLDAGTAAVAHSVAADDAPATGVQVHPAGARVVTSHADAAREWSLGRQEPVRVLPHPSIVTSIAYSRDGTEIAVGGEDGAIVVVDSGGTELRLEGHDSPVASVAFSPEGARLVSADDSKILVWDLESGAIVQRGPGRIVLPVTEVEWGAAGDTVAVALSQGEMYLFDAVTGERGLTFSSGASFHSAIAFHSGGLIFSADPMGISRGYAAGAGGAPLIELPNGGVPVRGIAVDPTSSVSAAVATLDADGVVKLWRDVASRSELPARSTALLYPHMSQAADRYLMGSHEYIFGIAIDAPPFADVVQAATGEVVRRIPTHRTFTLDRQPAISPDGRRAAVVGPDGDVALVDVEGSRDVTITGTSVWTKALTFDDSGGLLAGAGYDGTISVWDTDDVTTVVTINTQDAMDLASTAISASLPPAAIHDVAFRPRSTELAWARVDGVVGAWDVATGSLRPLASIGRAVTTVAYSPDGERLVLADGTGVVVVLDADTGDVILRADPVPGSTEIEYSPRGDVFAGAGPGPFVHVWNAESGRLLRRIRGAFGPPQGLVFVEGGAVLRVAGSAGVDRGYVLDPPRLVELAHAATSRDFTAAECERYLGSQCG